LAGFGPPKNFNGPIKEFQLNGGNPIKRFSFKKDKFSFQFLGGAFP